MVFSPFARQIYVAFSPQLSGLSIGGSLLYSSILLQQFKSNESTIRPDLDTLSWIPSVHGIASIGGLLMPSIMQTIGRKYSFITSCLLLSIGWSIAFAASNAAMIIVAESCLGFGCSCIVVVNLMTISEMLAPRYRTVSLMLLGITQATGVIFVTVLGTFIHWRILALIMCSPVVIALILVLFWPESPPWLAYKGRFTECEKAFKWLRGTDTESMKELEELISVQKRTVKGKKKLKQFCDKLKRRDFIMPSVFMLLLFLNFYLSGGTCLHIYGKYLLDIATGDETASTIGFLIINVYVIFGAFISIILIKRFDTKTIFYIALLRIVFLFISSFVLYLQNIGVLLKSPWIFISCFEGYMMFFYCGFNSLTFALAIELMPVKHRGTGGALYNIFTGLLGFVTNKSLPYLLIWLGVSWTLLLYAINGIIFQIVIWKYVPETKNRTLQEIEYYYKYGTYGQININEDAVSVPIIEKK